MRVGWTILATVWIVALCLEAGCGGKPASLVSPTSTVSPSASPSSTSSPLALALDKFAAHLQREDAAQYHTQGRLTGHADVLSVVRRYFAALLAGRAPGAAGVAGRAALAAYFPSGSRALATVRYLDRGKLAAADGALWPDGMQTRSLVEIHSLVVDRAGRRATMVVYPVHELWAYTDDTGGIHTGQFDGQTGDDWNAPMADGPHELTLVRHGAGWLINDDFTVAGEVEVPALLKAGGAPPSLWRAVARRIAARTAYPISVPPGVTATFERFLALLNEHDYVATDALFVGGAGYRAKMFARPYANWHYTLLHISGFDPLSQLAVTVYPDVPFVVDCSGPTYEDGGYDYAGGGMFGPSMWIAHRGRDGRWLIQGYTTDMPVGAGRLG